MPLLYLAFGILVLLGVTASKGHGVLREAENLVSDFQVKYLSALSEASDRIAIVAVTAEDYRNLFRSESPLDAEVLRAVLLRIAEGRPRVIAVDLETSDPRFKALASMTLPPTVWGRSAVLDERGLLIPGGFLGGASGPTSYPSGLVVLFDDPYDKLTRRYRRVIPSTEGELPGLPFLAAEAYDKRVTRGLRMSSELLTIRYAKVAYSEFPAGLILQPGFDWKGQIEGKLVLLGGRYDRDDHHTPLGARQGVEILANVIETELRGGGVSSPSGLLIFLFGLFALILVPVVIVEKRKLKGSLIILAIIPILALVFALLTPDLSFATWFYFSAILLMLLGLGVFAFWVFDLKVGVHDEVKALVRGNKS